MYRKTFLISILWAKLTFESQAKEELYDFGFSLLNNGHFEYITTQFHSLLHLVNYSSPFTMEMPKGKTIYQRQTILRNLGIRCSSLYSQKALNPRSQTTG
jgi:hypothetical protein